MRRATITVPDALDRALGNFMAAQPAKPSLTSVVEAALEAYLKGDPPQVSSRLVEVVRARSLIRDVVAKHGGERVGLFGSVSEGLDTAGSDIDLWVDVRPGTSLFDLAAMRAELEALLDAKVDVVTLGGLDDVAREALVEKSLVL